MKTNSIQLSYQELTISEMTNINGGGRGWSFLGKIIGEVTNALESALDFFATHDFPTTVSVPH